MSYSADPVLDADRHTDEMFRKSDEQDREEMALAGRFLAMAKQADANALCDFASTTDWDAMKRQPIDPRTATRLPKRQQTLAEVMAESLDYSDGPSLSEALQLLLNVAHGADLVNAPAQARALLGRMAEKWAYFNVGKDKE
jgi:hypothetical protein